MWRDSKYISGWFDGIPLNGLTELEEALKERNQAKKDKNYELADGIRQKMKERYGVTVKDIKYESYWVAGLETYRKFYKPYR